MTAVNLMDLIRKRHDGPAWIVIDEVGNGTGSHVSRHADAVAIGIWPSQGYEIHGYEIKVSRSDVQKELRDPSKADAVGKFCDYWWLAIADEKMIDGLTIPPTWGILAPRARVLRAIRKAPKRADVTPINRSFFAALTRRVVSGWVPRSEHNALKERAKEEAKKELQEERRWDKESAESELANLKQQIKEFEELSGVEVPKRWQGGNIGRAVATVLRARELGHDWTNTLTPSQLVRNEAAHIEQRIAQQEKSSKILRENLERVRRYAAELEVEERAPAPSDGSEGGLLDA